jgi:hypothetical protein
VNTVTQHAHDQEAAHPNGAQSSLSTQKNRKRDTIKTSKSKNIYNDVFKSMNDDACSIIDPLHKRKIMLPEDDPVMSKHVVDIF